MRLVLRLAREPVLNQPGDKLSLLAAYGEAIAHRKPDTDDGEPAPFSKVRSSDVGLRLDLSDPLHLIPVAFSPICPTM